MLPGLKGRVVRAGGSGRHPRDVRVEFELNLSLIKKRPRFMCLTRSMLINNNLYFKRVTPITMKYSTWWPSKNKIDNNKLQQSR